MEVETRRSPAAPALIEPGHHTRLGRSPVYSAPILRGVREPSDTLRGHSKRLLRHLASPRRHPETVETPRPPRRHPEAGHAEPSAAQSLAGRRIYSRCKHLAGVDAR